MAEKNIYINHNFNRNQLIDFRVENVGTGYPAFPAFGDRGAGSFVFDVDSSDMFFNTGAEWEQVNDGKVRYSTPVDTPGYLGVKVVGGDYIFLNSVIHGIYGGQLQINVDPITLNPELYFLELHDVDPASYVGQAGKSVIVNAGETGVEFGDPPGTTTYLDLLDTDASYVGQAGKVPEVNGAENALEFGNVPAISAEDIILPNRMKLAAVISMPITPDPHTIYFIIL